MHSPTFTLPRMTREFNLDRLTGLDQPWGLWDPNRDQMTTLAKHTRPRHSRVNEARTVNEARIMQEKEGKNTRKG